MTDPSGQSHSPSTPPVSVDTSGRFVLFKPVGRLPTDRVKELIDEMLGLPDFKEGMPSVWDLTEVDFTRTNTARLRSVAPINRDRATSRGSARVALFMGSEHDFGIGRMYQVLGAVPHLDIKPFRDLEEAIAWATDGVTGPDPES